MHWTHQERVPYALAGESLDGDGPRASTHLTLDELRSRPLATRRRVIFPAALQHDRGGQPAVVEILSGVAGLACWLGQQGSAGMKKWACIGEERSGHVHQLAQVADRVMASGEGLHELAAGGTAVGTGLSPAGG